MLKTWFRRIFRAAHTATADVRTPRAPISYRASRRVIWTVASTDPEPLAPRPMPEHRPPDWEPQATTVAAAPCTDAVATLRHVDPPRMPRPAGPVAWDRVHSRLGLTLPSDYRALIDDRGAGLVADVVLRAPGAIALQLDLEQWLSQVTYLVRSMRTVTCQHFPPAFYPEAGGLLAWGMADGLSLVAWITAHPDPDRWPVAVLSPTYDTLSVHPVGTTAFLLSRLPGPDLRELAEFS